jgi:hypothetical protein
MASGGQLGRFIRASRTPASANHPYFPHRTSVIAAIPALKSSATPAKITFGLNSNRHLVRLETDVTVIMHLTQKDASARLVVRGKSDEADRRNARVFNG